MLFAEVTLLVDEAVIGAVERLGALAGWNNGPFLLGVCIERQGSAQVE
jgi:hypothetical protein